ncbi:MAG TPA: class I SAM-dependent methyltransferase [Acidimicrobiales bacterium]|nr:class I SAM-dependent methyltransferase [Acidimicrobiales bacterium]
MEGHGPHSYGDGIADAYDDWYGDQFDTAAAVDALAALVPQTGTRRLLELGIGTGRLALPLVDRGFDVWGVDASTAMVDRLHDDPRGRTIPLAVGDMADVDLDALPGGASARFAVVFVAVNTFFNLTSADAQAHCLDRVRAVLEPAGAFVLEGFVPAVDRTSTRVDARTIELDHVILTASRHDADEQLVTGQHIEIRESGIKLRPWMIRYAPPAELDAMAAAAGLHLAARWSDWKGTAFADGDNVHVSVYRPN